MKDIFLPFAILLACICASGNAGARMNICIRPQKSQTTSATERADILNTLRQRVEKELGQKVKFVVQNIQRGGDWVLIQVRPVQLGGADINYKTTDYYKIKGNKERIDDGFFDDHVLALLKIKNGKWSIIEYEIGNTDYSGEYWKEQHHIVKFFGGQ